MDTTDLHASLEDLSGNIDDLEEALAPILNTALSTRTGKLPLLDKAKLYVLATYAIESLLFSYLRLNSVDAKSHPVFRELTRVKQYFEKIKVAESTGVKRNTTLDKGAASRFIKHGLAGNEKYDRDRAELSEREKAGAKRKFEDMTERVGSHTRFEAMSKKTKADEAEGLARKAESSSLEEEHDPSSVVTSQNGSKAKLSSHRGSTEQQPSKDGIDKAPRKARRKRTATEVDEGRHVEPRTDASGPSSDAPPAENVAPRRSKSHKPPLGHSAAFQALLNGPLPKQDEQKPKKKKRKSRDQAT